MKSQIDAQTPNDLKLTDAPAKQREALGGGTNANAASHVEEKGAFGAAPCSARLVVTSSGSIYNLDHIVSIFPATVENGNFWMYMSSNKVIHSIGNQDAYDIREWIMSQTALPNARKLSCIPFSGTDATTHLVNQAQMQSPTRPEKPPQSNSHLPQ